MKYIIYLLLFVFISSSVFAVYGSDTSRREQNEYRHLLRMRYEQYAVYISTDQQRHVPLVFSKIDAGRQGSLCHNAHWCQSGKSSMTSLGTVDDKTGLQTISRAKHLAKRERDAKRQLLKYLHWKMGFRQ